MAFDWGTGRYQYITDGELHSCSHWNDLPDQIQELIEWVPEIPPGPHTQQQHDDIERLPEIFMEFLARCQR
ncbi:hypothetical protein H9C73_02790 [Marinobacterium sp. AK62]|uniref:Uncharacterized protein n=1 Tax=Marinobacterium alkalitolerans TaxID=1542925 RepID=A0ABS3Z7G0_9GAMM|nr:hypothetical protein [Marinobacterium alkalitolerans]MBP0047651.1 hypothetical protein [Marinobacterium alkalitolerans]